MSSDETGTAVTQGVLLLDKALFDDYTENKNRVPMVVAVVVPEYSVVTAHNLHLYALGCRTHATRPPNNLRNLRTQKPSNPRVVIFRYFKKVKMRFPSQSFSRASSRTDLRPFQLYQPSAPTFQTSDLTGSLNVSCAYVCVNVLPPQLVCRLHYEHRTRCHGNGACDGAVLGCTGNPNNPLRVSVTDDESRGNRHIAVEDVVKAVEVR